MRDFSLIVRRKLGRLPLEPARAHEISTELAHQLEDRFQDSIERGLPEARALADALGQFGDWEKVRRAILSAELGENIMWPQPSAVSRRACWAALAMVALLCLVPSYRQAQSSSVVERAIRGASCVEELRGEQVGHGIVRVPGRKPLHPCFAVRRITVERGVEPRSDPGEAGIHRDCLLGVTARRRQILEVEGGEGDLRCLVVPQSALGHTAQRAVGQRLSRN